AGETSPPAGVQGMEPCVRGTAPTCRCCGSGYSRELSVSPGPFRKARGYSRSHKVLFAVAVAFDLAPDLRGPSEAAEPADKTPQGRRTWMCGVLRGGRMPPRKIPPAPRTRRAAAGAQAGCVSLRQASLHKQRKVARAPSARNA